jgi:3-deoxy-D-manno-octulosonic-acid transferase
MQSDLDRDRLLALGLSPQKVRTIGNIKYDRDWRPMDDHEKAHWRRILNLDSEYRLWIAGSTHEQEDEILLDVFKRLLPLFPALRLLIAPRRIERAGQIRVLAEQRGLSSLFKTDLTGEGAPFGAPAYDVLVLDTIGDLNRLYGLAEISFVGGSLVPVGGHNLLEPAAFGCPVLFGPHVHNFVLMSELLIAAGGGIMVKDEDGLFRIVKGLLSSRERAHQMGAKAKEFVAMNRGAVTRIMAHIGECIRDA